MLGDPGLVNREVAAYRCRHGRPTLPRLQRAAPSAPNAVPPLSTARHDDTTAPRNTTPTDEVAHEPGSRLLANGSTLHTLCALTDFEVAARHLRVPRRIGACNARFLSSASADRQHARRGDTRHDGAPDRRTARLSTAPYYDVNIDRDYAYISFCMLSKFFDETLAVAEQILLHPVFPEEELRTYRAKRKQRLAVERTKVEHPGPRGFRPRPFRALAPLRHLGRRSPIR